MLSDRSLQASLAGVCAIAAIAAGWAQADPVTLGADLRLKVWNYGGWGPGQHEIYWQYATLSFTPDATVPSLPCCDSLAFDSTSSVSGLTDLTLYSTMQGYQGVGLPPAALNIWAFPLNSGASFSNLSDPGILAQANLRTTELVGSCGSLPSFNSVSGNSPAGNPLIFGSSGFPGAVDALVIHNRSDFGIDCSTERLNPSTNSFTPINPTGFSPLPSDPAAQQLAKDGSWLVDVDLAMPNALLPPNQQVNPGYQQNPKPLPPNGPAVASWFDHYDLLLYSKKTPNLPANATQFPFYLGVRPIDSANSRLFYQEFVQTDSTQQVGLFRKAWGTSVEQSNVICVSESCEASPLVPVTDNAAQSASERYAHAMVSVSQPLTIPARLGYKLLASRLNNTQVHIWATRVSDGKRVDAIALPDSEFDPQINLISAKSRFSGLYPSAGGINFADTLAPETLRKYAPVSAAEGVDASQFRYLLMLDDVPGAAYNIDCQISGSVNFNCSDLVKGGVFNQITLQGKLGPVSSGSEWNNSWNNYTVGQVIYGNSPQPYADPYPLFTMSVNSR